jgi:DNA gyrase subunit A
MKKIEDELYESYFKYARSVIEDRAVPNVLDGLKGVQRRIAYSMFSTKNFYNDKHRKCAKIVGDVMGNYHPHGDQSIYGALVRMAQPFAYRIPMIDGQGNFGSIDGDNAAAFRYTEARLALYSNEFFTDFNYETVQMKPNYDGTLKEPINLPTRVPNILINGAHGIAVGISTSIPPHNLCEIMDGLLHYINNPECSLDDILQFVQGPDLPTGGTISGRSELYKAYSTGEGNVTMRGNYILEDDYIVFTEIPYMTQKGDIMQQLATAINEGRIDGVSTIRDESDRDGIRVVLKIKNGYAKEIIINQVYSATSLKSTLRFCFFALNEKGEPKMYNLLEYFRTFIKFREEVVITRTTYELEKTKKRMHLLIGLSVALENLKEIMDGVAKCESSGDARQFLNSKRWKCARIKEYMKSLHIKLEEDTYELSPEQTKGILELKLQNLVKLEVKKLEDELDQLRKIVEACNIILNSKEKRKEIICAEFEEIKAKYPDKRRTKIEDSFVKFSQKDLVTPDDIMIILDKNNYIKRVSLSTYKTQNKGGKGRSGAGEDVAESIVASTHSMLLMFSDKGLVYVLYGYEIPEGEHHTKGRAIINLLNIDKDEQIVKFLVISEDKVKDPSGQYLLFIHANGQVRRNALEQFTNIRANGKKYIKSDDEFCLISVVLAADNDMLFLATKKGMAVCTPIEEFRVFNSRDSEGVRGCKLRENDRVIGAIILKSKNELILSVTENGIGKISSAEDYRTTHRGSVGVINIKTSEKNGKVVDVTTITKEDEVILITQKSQFLRFCLETMRTLGRNTSGVKLCNVTVGDKVVSIKKIVYSEEFE